MTKKRPGLPAVRTQVAAFGTSVFAPSQGVFGENASEWARRVLLRVSTGSAVEIALSLVSLVGVRYVRELLAQAILMKKIGRGDLEQLYLSQRDEVFSELPLVTLEFLSSINSDGAQIFTLEDLHQLEAKRHGDVDTMRYIPYERDLSYFLFDEERRRTVPAEVLTRWGGNLQGRDTDMLAVIDVELIKRKVRRLSQSDIGHRLKVAAKQDPKGNAVRVYLELLFRRSARKGSVRSEVVSVLLEMLSPAERTGKIDFTAAHEIFKFYVNNPLVPLEDREWVVSEMTQYCEAFAGHYLRFVEEGVSENPFRTRRS